MINPFSYREYKEIISHILETHPIIDYSEVTKEHTRFCVIRHDVEFSVDRALDLATYEHLDLGIKSSFLLQIRNNCYNLASDINIEKIHKIKNLGHKIGIHIHLELNKDNKNIHRYIENEAILFEKITGIPIDRFSYHRPTGELLKQYIEIPNLINCYGKDFFEYYEHPHNNIDVKYYTDSRHSWQHGYPINLTHDRVQLLTHPYSWTETGNNNFNNYQNLLHEKIKELKESINRETSTFPHELL